MFSRSASRSTPAPTAAAAQPWTEELFDRTFHRIGEQMLADIQLHSLTIFRASAPAADNIPARIYFAKIALQGAAGGNGVFCDLEVLHKPHWENPKGPAGKVIFTYLYNPATGACDIPNLSIQLFDHDGTLTSVFRDAFAAAGKGGRVGMRLHVADLTWAVIEENLPKHKAFFDLASFSLWECWGTPINPYVD